MIRVFNLFRNKGVKRMFSVSFRGQWHIVQNEYVNFLFDANIEVVSTSITQDFERYGNSECFILLVTFKRKK